MTTDAAIQWWCGLCAMPWFDWRHVRKTGCYQVSVRLVDRATAGAWDTA